MKKYWLPMLFAAFLILAPAALAADATAEGTLQELIDQLVAIFAGDEQEADHPPSGDSLLGDEPEIGLACPPGG